MLLWIKIDLVRIGTMRVQIKIWSVLDAILQMILYRVVIYSSLVEQRGRGEMCVWLFRHEMEGYLLYRNAITSLFAWFYAEDRLQSPSWSLNLAHLWEEQVGRTIDSIWQHMILSAQYFISYCNFSGEELEISLLGLSPAAIISKVQKTLPWKKFERWANNLLQWVFIYCLHLNLQLNIQCWCRSRTAAPRGGRVREFGKPSEFEENLKGRKVCRGMTI